ncbi:MAG: 50S ribosomal protein L29 [Bacteroidota bacterium]
MKRLEIEELSTDEIRERITSEKFNYNKLKLNHKISPVEKSSDIKKARKMVARLITVLKEREAKALQA